MKSAKWKMDNICAAVLLCCRTAVNKGKGKRKKGECKGQIAKWKMQSAKWKMQNVEVNSTLNT
jgi:hypothetical protein